MKKTIAVMFALATTVASADTLGTTTFNRTGTTVDTVEVSTTGEILSLTLDRSSVANFQNNAASNLLTPNINVGLAAGNSWTLTFTLTNTSSDIVTVDSIALAAFGTRGDGTVQPLGGINVGAWSDSKDYYVGYEGAAQNVPVDFSITGAGTWAINMAMNGSSLGDIAENRTATFTISTPWVLKAGDSVTFDVTAANSELFDYTRGTFAGINQLSFSGSVAPVPEPATATLSLLALAGLAARRRRK